MSKDLIKYILLAGIILYSIRYIDQAYKTIKKEGFSSWFWSVEEESFIGFSKGQHLILNILAIVVGIFVFLNN